MNTYDSSPETSGAASRTTTESSTAAPLPTPQASSRRGGAGQILLWLVVLVLAGALAWIWQDGKKRSVEWQMNTAQRLGALEKTQSGQIARDAQHESRFQLAQEKIAALETRLDEVQTSRQALEKLYQQLLPLRDEVTMREVEYRVRFAGQQLSMVGNVPSALAALQEADAELASLNRSDLAALKAALAQDIEALQHLPTFDARYFLTRFDTALNTVDHLALREIPTAMPKTEVVIDETLPSWKRWWLEAKETALSMVRLRIGEFDASGPHVADAALDRQELRLRLLSLRLMVLSRQPAVHNEAMATRAWLGQHFSDVDPQVQTLQVLLDELAASPLGVSSAMPQAGVTKTLQALRAWRAEQYRQTAPMSGAAMAP